MKKKTIDTTILSVSLMPYRWPCNTKPKLSEPKLSGNLILMLNSALSHFCTTENQTGISGGMSRGSSSFYFGAKCTLFSGKQFFLSANLSEG